MNGMEKEQRFRQALAALQKYCENPNNRLSGPQYVRLVDEFFAASDALKRED